jgi:histidinol-phosphatase (PHP family)
LGLRRISIIEHYPLPPDFPKPPTRLPVSFEQDLVEPYLEEALALRDEFAGSIEVLVGFEWDYLPGWEGWTREQLDLVGPRLQDGILSVHFVREAIVDGDAEIFTRDLLPIVGGTLEGAYDAYYQTVLNAVRADLGPHKPKRLGHINVIRKFQKEYPAPGEYREEILGIVNQAAACGMQIELNTSGLRKRLCGEVYLPEWLLEPIARGEIDIEVIYGSDAHQASDVGAGLQEAKAMVLAAMASGGLGGSVN